MLQTDTAGPIIVSILESSWGGRSPLNRMQIAKCRTYHAHAHGRGVARMLDGQSVFKLYYISIIGRGQPERYDWQYSPRSPAEFEQVFVSGGHEGIGFAIVFPHVTKIYRFSPDMETILDVREYETDGMTPRDCSRRDGFHEFACYAEAVIAADEYRAWAKAATVNEYLAFRSDAAEFQVVSNNKLAAYWIVR